MGGAPGPGQWAPLGPGPSDAAAARGTAARAQALHAIEQTQLGIRGTEFHWLRLLVVVALRLLRLPVSSRRPTLLSSDL